MQIYAALVSDLDTGITVECFYTQADATKFAKEVAHDRANGFEVEETYSSDPDALATFVYSDNPDFVQVRMTEIVY
jgi:hypothetical protein